MKTEILLVMADTVPGSDRGQGLLCYRLGFRIGSQESKDLELNLVRQLKEAEASSRSSASLMRHDSDGGSVISV